VVESQSDRVLSGNKAAVVDGYEQVVGYGVVRERI
jgi:hypothetical protein